MTIFSMFRVSKNLTQSIYHSDAIFSNSDSATSPYKDSFRIVDTLIVNGKLVKYNLGDYNEGDYKSISKLFYNKDKKHLITNIVCSDSTVTIDEIRSKIIVDNYLFVDHYYFQALNEVHKMLFCMSLPYRERLKTCENDYKGISINLDLRNEFIINNKETPEYKDSIMEIFRFKHKVYLIEMSVCNFTSTWAGIGIPYNHVKDGMIQFVTPYCKYVVK